MKTKRLAGLILCAILASSTGWGCSKNEPTESAPVTVKGTEQGKAGNTMVSPQAAPSGFKTGDLSGGKK